MAAAAGGGGAPAAADAAAGGPRDLLIVGPGVLGSYAGVLWRQAFPDAAVTAQTNTEASHGRLRALGLAPVTRAAAAAAAAEEGGRRFPYVLFAAPPSGSEDYPGAVAAAARQWDPSQGGAFVFTSSMSVCATEDGSTVAEDCPLVPEGRAPGTDKLLGAERAALAAGGNVLRLVGLYHARRGPHTFFVRTGDVPRFGGYVVNMLHYEDAAGLAVAVLRGDGGDGGDGGAPYRGRVFVGADGAPLTFDEMAAACAASGLFGEAAAKVRFTGTADASGSSGRGKVVDNAATRAALGGWRPKYPSFAAFFAREGNAGRDWYADNSELWGGQ